MKDSQFLSKTLKKKKKGLTDTENQNGSQDISLYILGKAVFLFVDYISF